MYPMLFQLRGKDKTTHCGVLEFVAEPNRMYLPEWVCSWLFAVLILPKMMANLNLAEGDVVNLQSVTLRSVRHILAGCTNHQCSYAKFKPQSVDFLDISNPKAVCVFARLSAAHRF